jgi:hypothetical protein
MFHVEHQAILQKIFFTFDVPRGTKITIGVIILVYCYNDFSDIL